jgi:predicted kinase
MSGCPGGGKSTFAKNKVTKNDSYISRDQVRFSILKPDEKYFSKEKQVFSLFIQEVNNEISKWSMDKNKNIKHNIYVDATHLTKKSRAKTISRLAHLYDSLSCIFIDTELYTCLERNSKRNERECVPETNVIDMFYSIEDPTLDEGFDKIEYITDLEEELIDDEYELSYNIKIIKRK